MSKIFKSVFTLLYMPLIAISQVNYECKNLFLERDLPEYVHKTSIAKSDKKVKKIFQAPSYFIMLRSFGKRDIASVENALDTLSEMGVKQVWISPTEPQTMDKIINSNTGEMDYNNHGYWPREHGVVDEKLGGEKAFKKLIKKAKKLGISIIVDSVLDHFGYGEKFKIGDKKIDFNDTLFFRSPDQEFSVAPDELSHKLENSNDPNGIRELLNIFVKYKIFGLPSFNHNNFQIQNYLIDSYKKYLDMGVNSFRIDGVKHIPIEFLSRFVNKLGKYSPEKLTFLFEVLFVKYPVLDVYIKDLVKNIKGNTENIFFIDFPFAHEVRQLFYRYDYKFHYIKEFIRYRENGTHDLNRFVPMLEDHDFLTPMNGNLFNKKIVYLITEFFSKNSTILFQGTEKSGKAHLAREHIDKVEKGDVSTIVQEMSKGLENFRNDSDKFFKTNEIIIEDDFMILEKNDSKGNSIFLCINKGESDRSYSFYNKGGGKFKRILSGDTTNINVRMDGKDIKINAPQKSFSVFEISK